jgi:hypothetical protein
MNIQKLELFNFTLQVFILLIQGGILLIPFLGSGTLYDKRRTFWKKFSTRGYTLLALATLLIIITLEQNEVATKINNTKESINNKNSAKRDSLNQVKNENSDFKTKEMLAKYGLEVNTKNDEIKRILQDSTLRKTVIQNGAEPDFGMTDITMRDSLGQNLFKQTYGSKEAPSYNINFKVDLIVMTNDNKYVYWDKNFQTLASNSVISKDKGTVTQFFVKKYPNCLAYFFHLKGKYTDVSLKKIYLIDRIYGYHLKYGFCEPNPVMSKGIEKLIASSK